MPSRMLPEILMSVFNTLSLFLLQASDITINKERALSYNGLFHRGYQMTWKIREGLSRDNLYWFWLRTGT
jgi:hypothetical protein